MCFELCSFSCLFSVYFVCVQTSFSVYFVCVQNIVGADFFIFRRAYCYLSARLFLPPDAPSAPLPCRGGVGGGVSIFKGGGVCNSHREVNILTQRNRGSRGIFSRRGAEAFGGLGGSFQSEGGFSEFGESATVGRSPLPPFPSMRPGAAPFVPSVPLCENISLRAQNFSAPLRENIHLCVRQLQSP